MKAPRRLQTLADELTGRSYRSMLLQIEQQIGTCLDGVTLARSAAVGRLDLAQAHADMTGIEQAGDSERIDLTGQLYRALTTPMDREDIFRLSRGIDDVLDNLRDYVRETHLYDIAQHPAAVPLFDDIAVGLRTLREAVRDIRLRTGQASERAIAARRIGNQVRRTYLTAMAKLFTDQLDVELLKRRELLRRLDVVGLRLAEAADALSNGLLKRSH